MGLALGQVQLSCIVAAVHCYTTADSLVHTADQMARARLFTFTHHHHPRARFHHGRTLWPHDLALLVTYGEKSTITFSLCPVSVLSHRLILGNN